MSDDLREILMRGTRTSRGVYEVVQKRRAARRRLVRASGA